MDGPSAGRRSGFRHSQTAMRSSWRFCNTARGCAQLDRTRRTRQRQRQPPVKRPTPATMAGCTGGSGGSSPYSSQPPPPIMSARVGKPTPGRFEAHRTTDLAGRPPRVIWRHAIMTLRKGNNAAGDRRSSQDIIKVDEPQLNACSRRQRRYGPVSKGVWRLRSEKRTSLEGKGLEACIVLGRRPFLGEIGTWALPIAGENEAERSLRFFTRG